MKWTKLTIDTTCEAEDLISAFLEEEGVLGVQIEDNIPLTEEEMETMFVDLLPDDMPENDGTAKVLNDEFEMDKTVGNNASREQTKVRADSTATRDNKDQSVYTRKSNGASIGCENDMGNVNMFLYQKTKEENENVGIQIETSKTKKIPVETRRVFNRNQGVYQNDKVQDEIEEHTENGCEPKDVKDFDGKEYTETHEQIDIDYYVRQIQNYDNEDGEQSINEVFTEKEIKDKLLRDLDKYKDKISTEQIIENVKNEMDADAQIYTREHKLEQ